MIEMQSMYESGGGGAGFKIRYNFDDMYQCTNVNYYNCIMWFLRSFQLPLLIFHFFYDGTDGIQL